jgi:hypothetical protein
MVNLKETLKSILRPVWRWFRREIYQRLQSVRVYYERFGRFPNIIQPRAFSEKLLKKIMFSRDPRLTLFADKYLVRHFVRLRLEQEQYLPRLYGVIEDPGGLSKLALPEKFVMKPNHLSGKIKIVRGPEELEMEELERLSHDWLQTNYYYRCNEWAYKDIRPRILFEEWLGRDDVPDDYKFFCFNGQPRFMQVDKGRFKNHRRNFYDMDFNLLPFKLDLDNFVEQTEVPPNFEEMIDVSQKLSYGVDFLRVDLYNISGRVVFGELTNYPGAGTDRYRPLVWDEKIGSYWK